MMTTQTLQIPVSGTIEQKVDGVDLVRLLRQERYKESGRSAKQPFFAGSEDVQRLFPIGVWKGSVKR